MLPRRLFKVEAGFLTIAPPIKKYSCGGFVGTSNLGTSNPKAAPRIVDFAGPAFDSKVRTRVCRMPLRISEIGTLVRHPAVLAMSCLPLRRAHREPVEFLADFDLTRQP